MAKNQKFMVEPQALSMLKRYFEEHNNLDREIQYLRNIANIKARAYLDIFSLECSKLGISPDEYDVNLDTGEIVTKPEEPTRNQ